MNVRRMAPLREFEYMLAWSIDGQSSIPVLSTRLDLITVLDIDRDEKGRLALDVPRIIASRVCHGLQETPNGVHLYLKSGSPLGESDRKYLVLSSNRQRWHERIRNSDGSFRSLPVAFTPTGTRHQLAFTKAREMLRRGISLETSIDV